MSKLEMILRENKLVRLVKELFSMQKVKNIDEKLKTIVIYTTVEDIFNQVIKGFEVIDKNLVISFAPEQIEVEGFVISKEDNEQIPNFRVKHIERGILLQFKGPESDVQKFFKSVEKFYDYVDEILFIQMGLVV